MDDILFIIVSSIIFYTIIFIAIAFQVVGVFKERNKLKEYEVNIQTPIDENTPNLLNAIILEAYQEFLLLNPKYEESLYINAELEEEMVRGVGKLLAGRVSKHMHIKLCMYYNTDTLPDTITNKIYILALDYISDHNRIKNNK